MAGISQTIPNYYGGISEQPDQLKNPGQVKDALNVIPDITYGLYKRPGSKRVIGPDTSSGVLSSVQPNGSWFHYYRDEAEGSYIGQIDKDGTPRVWRCSDAKEMTIAYGSTTGAAQSNLRTYLTPSAAGNTEDIQFCTINDTTFINNRTKAVTINTDLTSDRPHAYGAYVELLRTENGRQYSLNIHDGSTTLTDLNKATRVKINSDDLSTTWGTGNCRGIGVQVWGDGDYTAQSGKKHLVFRITVLGQVGDRASDDDGDSGEGSYRCAYSKSIDLLHGGEGWVTGNTVGAQMTQADGGATGGNLNVKPSYEVKVTDHETTKVRGTINSGVYGIIRPSPTPWDTQTAVSADSILGGLYTELQNTGLSRQIIGNGIYLSSSSPFTVEVCDPDLMRVMQHEINDVSKLPTQCYHGYIVKVTNSQQSDEDDYYLKFQGQNNKDGPGSWVECAAPGIRKNFSRDTMPVTIKRTGATTFTLDRFDWDARTVGDDKTNPIPTFVSINSNHPDYDDEDDLRYINKVLFFRNRLAFLSGPSVITSQPGDFGNFWADTALTVSGIDPVDISMSSTLPSALYDGIEINAGLLVFTANSQHLLSSDDTVFNPDTAKLRTISSYNYNKIIPPISLGTTIGFLDNSNKYSRFNEMANISREGQAIVIDQTKVVPSLLAKDIDLITNSRENGLVFFGKTGEGVIYGLKTVTVGDQRLQSAWFRWRLNTPIKYHFIEDDKYYFLDTDNFLQSINLTQNDADPSIDEEGTNFLIHLDNWSTVQGGVYSSTTNLTTFTDGNGGCELTWQGNVTSPQGTLVVIDTDSGSARIGRYVPVTVTSAGTSFTLPGDWSREVSAITVTNGGSGYTSAPTVTITPAAWQASTAYKEEDMVTNDSGKVYRCDTDGTSAGSGGPTGTSANITDGSTKWDFVTIGDATATATISDGKITAITITDGGYNYTSEPIITITGGGGSSAAATATIHDGEYYIGYVYNYQVDFPRLYTTKQVGQNTVADTSSSLVLHRLNLSLGKVGLYETILTRVGKNDYIEVYESTPSNLYNVADAAYLDEVIQTVPVYEKNKNVDITLKSYHPSPCTLRSLQWEGDYSPMYYRRG